MGERKRREFPADRLKLHEMCSRLEAEIARKQEKLDKARKLAKEADNADILNTVQVYNVTPEELNKILMHLRGNTPDPEFVIQNSEVKSRDDHDHDIIDIAGDAFEVEENEDE